MRLTYELLDEKRAQIEDPALASVYFHTGVILMNAENRFISDAHNLARHLQRVADGVERGGGSVNGLGEVGGLGSAVDSAAGNLNACSRWFGAIERLAFPQVSA